MGDHRFPWVHDVDRGAFSATLAGVRAIEPSLVCSSHIPSAPGSMLGVLIDALAATPDAQRFEGPDQAALEAILSGIAPVA